MQPTCISALSGAGMRTPDILPNASDSLMCLSAMSRGNLTYSESPSSRRAGSCRGSFRTPPGWDVAVHAHCKVHCAHAQEPLHYLSVQDCQCSSRALAPNQHLIKVGIPGICKGQCGTAPQQSASHLLLYQVSAAAGSGRTSGCLHLPRRQGDRRRHQLASPSWAGEICAPATGSRQQPAAMFHEMLGAHEQHSLPTGVCKCHHSTLSTAYPCGQLQPACPAPCSCHCG